MRCLDGDRIWQRTMILPERAAQETVQRQQQWIELWGRSPPGKARALHCRAQWGVVNALFAAASLMPLVETTQVTSWERKRKPWNTHQVLRYFLLVQNQEHTASERKGEGARGGRGCELKVFRSASIGLFNHVSLVNIFLTSWVMPPFYETSDNPFSWSISLLLANFPRVSE